MKNLLLLAFLSTLYSCATERDLMLEGRAKSEALTAKIRKDVENESTSKEKFDWYIMYKDENGLTKTKITKDIVKVAEDIYCEIAKEHKQLMFEQHTGMIMKTAQCKYLLDTFQLKTFCDSDNGLVLKTQIKNEENFRITLQCVGGE